MNTAAFPIDLGQLQAQQDRLQLAFESGDPIRHVVIEDFLTPAAATRAAHVFPKPEEMAISFAGLAEVKNAEQGLQKVDPIFGEIFEGLRAPPFLQWLSH